MAKLKRPTGELLADVKMSAFRTAFGMKFFQTNLINFSNFTTSTSDSLSFADKPTEWIPSINFLRAVLDSEPGCLMLRDADDVKMKMPEQAVQSLTVSYLTSLITLHANMS